MLKILLIIPSSTSQKITHYSYFILKSLPIIPTLLSCFIVSSGDIQRSKEYIHFVVGSYSVNVSDTSKTVNESHFYLFSSLLSLFAYDFNIEYIATDYDCIMPANVL